MHRWGAVSDHGSRGRAGSAVRPGVCQRGGPPGAVGLQRGCQRADCQAGARTGRPGAHLHGGPVQASEHLRDSEPGESGGRACLHNGQQRRRSGWTEAAGLSG